MFDLITGQKVLVVWSSNENPEKLQTVVEGIKNIVGTDGSVSVENSEMLLSSNHAQSNFNAAVLDESSSQTEIFISLLEEILRVLKPCGKLFIRSNNSLDSLLSNLKLSGFTNITESLNYEENISEIKAYKPDFEIGSAVKLSFNNSRASDGIGKFKLDLDDPEVQFDNPDDLLSEEDLQRPDPASLKVCGTTGKRKACKTCVCGLKEELDAENEAKAKANKDYKPSCGNCYLGDAFRCGSCPYLGMPAFKPGEKVKLTDDTLQDVV